MNGAPAGAIAAAVGCRNVANKNTDPTQATPIAMWSRRNTSMNTLIPTIWTSVADQWGPIQSRFGSPERIELPSLAPKRYPGGTRPRRATNGVRARARPSSVTWTKV
jgi:hypothetical protein